jgi:hypothetical protein
MYKGGFGGKRRISLKIERLFSLRDTAGASFHPFAVNCSRYVQKHKPAAFSIPINPLEMTNTIW